jgi:hypothetical protein
MAFDTRSLTKAKEYVERVQQRMARMREKSEEVIGEGIAAAEVAGTAFGLGYANARFGERGSLQMFGVPVDLGVAVAMHGLAFAGGLGKYAEHGHNIGTGALACYAYRTGAELGSASRAQGQLAGRGAAAQLRGVTTEVAGLGGGDEHATNGAAGTALFHVMPVEG